jgi:hypothetical protein
MNYDKKAMTAFAQAALATSELIGAKFANTTFSGQVNRTVKVVAPQVESTQGGKQARESINLVPTDNDPSRTITCGFLDVGLRSAELRSYASLNMLHRQRHNQPLDLHQSDYDKFLGELKALLEGEGFIFKLIEPEEQQAKAVQATGEQPVKKAGGNMGVMIGIGVVAALIVVAVIALIVLK